LSVVPTAGLRETLSKIASIGAHAPIVWACKGFEKASGKLAHEVLQEVLSPQQLCGVLSGPSFALEVAQNKPAALTLASTDEQFAQDMAKALRNDRLRIYSSTDVIGVEFGGAIKNIIAIAAGICDGLQLGNNARAALITRGLAEATRLGLHMGGHWETFMGLAGLGDMVLTTTGDLSRNRQVGLSLAQGQTINTILQNLKHVAEGVHTAPEVAKIAGNLGIDMPITRTVCRIIEGKITAQAAVDELMRRDTKSEGMS
jgi:glycerol-3-phosphate dehydrogenase (NAD(P)+)